MFMYCVLSNFWTDTLVANDADAEPRSAQDSVHVEPELAGTAQEMAHTEVETECNQAASSAEVVVDSDSVYSVCCSDVTNEADTPDIVHVDYESPVATGRGTTSYFMLLSLSLFTHPFVRMVELCFAANFFIFPTLMSETCLCRWEFVMDICLIGASFISRF